jgi:hypothetical protein
VHDCGRGIAVVRGKILAKSRFHGKLIAAAVFRMLRMAPDPHELHFMFVAESD